MRKGPIIGMAAGAFMVVAGYVGYNAMFGEADTPSTPTVHVDPAIGPGAKFSQLTFQDSGAWESETGAAQMAGALDALTDGGTGVINLKNLEPLNHPLYFKVYQQAIREKGDIGLGAALARDLLSLRSNIQRNILSESEYSAWDGRVSSLTGEKQQRAIVAYSDVLNKHFGEGKPLQGVTEQARIDKILDAVSRAREAFPGVSDRAEIDTKGTTTRYAAASTLTRTL